MKLKTLKDLDNEIENVGCRNYGQDNFTEKLKAEAIKWVKDFRERKDEIWESDFMKFHNITEEDLK